ncbi:hypothetical protein C808_02266 [Lachnospiraceae bacterium M18-1]|nr:hypothetical protein C808_02266 [Lachnospiraceae bacterium M18-1]
MYYKRIRDLRCDNDLRQVDVADFLGCHEGVYRRYENGSREIPIWALLKLAERYDVSVDYILEVTDHKRKFGE